MEPAPSLTHRGRAMDDHNAFVGLDVHKESIDTRQSSAASPSALWTQPLSRVELLTRFGTRLQSYIRPASQSSTFRILWRDERNPRVCTAVFQPARGRNFASVISLVTSSYTISTGIPTRTSSF